MGNEGELTGGIQTYQMLQPQVHIWLVKVVGDLIGCHFLSRSIVTECGMLSCTSLPFTSLPYTWLAQDPAYHSATQNVAADYWRLQQITGDYC